MTRLLVTGFCTLPGPTRAGVQLRHVIDGLSRAYHVDVLVAREGGQRYVEQDGRARMLRVPIPSEGHDGGEIHFRERVDVFRRALARQLSGADYRVVHFCDGWSGIPVLELRERYRYLAVFDVSRIASAERDLQDLQLSSKNARQVDQCIRGADFVVVPSPEVRDMIAGQRDPATVFVVPPGVDIDLFDWDEAPRVGPPVIVYAGALAPGSGVRILLRAMVTVVAQSDARLVLAGPAVPGFLETLVEQANEYGIGGRVDFVGELEHRDVPSLIAGAAICVAPAAPEIRAPTDQYPSKLLEYLACRGAVVAPRRSSVTSLVRHGEHALLFRAGDSADLARAIARLLADVGSAHRMAENGYRLVRNHHSASATRRAVRSAYRQMSTRFQDTGEGIFTEIGPLPTSSLVDSRGGLEGQTDRRTNPLIEMSDQTASLTDQDGSSQTTVEDTRVDLHPRPVSHGPMENRFVAGELQVPTPRPAPMAVSGTLEVPDSGPDGCGSKD